MRKYLDTPKIDYILTHLKFRCDFPNELNQRLVFLKQEDISALPENCLIFPLSNQEKELDYQIDNIPIFYPTSPRINEHTYRKNTSIIFSHDIFQQIFCLQTLYYEQDLKEKDKLGRIKPEATLNFQLGFLNRPLVDYLFAIIVDVLEDYCQMNNIPFKRINLLPQHTFLLSHDVDRIETYSLYNTINSVKQVLLQANKKNFTSAKKHIIEYFRFQNRDNSLWDFPLLRKIEQEFNLKSTYYFLNKGKLHQDAYYSLTSPQILALINTIQADQNEIGLHLTIAGNQDESIVAQNLEKLNKLIKEKIVGTRSHWLRFEARTTPDILEKLGIIYDSSIGHYSHEGFRSGTCLPYKLFSFSQNRILNIWELPLIYMDCMILDYQDISEREALNKLSALLQEVIKFKGIYSVLWHNGNFANPHPYNRYKFYRNIIKMVLRTDPSNLTAKSLLESLEESK